MPIADYIITAALNAPHGTRINDVAHEHGVNPNTLRKEVGWARSVGQVLHITTEDNPRYSLDYTKALTGASRPLHRESYVSNAYTQHSGVQTASQPLPRVPLAAELIEHEPLQVDALNFIALCDIHAPLHHEKTIQRALQVADHEQIDTLIIQGDLFDFASASSHGRAEVAAGINRTLEAGGRLLDLFLDYFAKIYIVTGNHDERVSRKLDEPLNLEYMVRAAVKRGAVSSDITSNAPIITSDYSYLYVGEQETGWVIGHPTRYSRTSVKYSTVAMRERRNVLLSHSHQQTISWSDCGNYILIDPGCATDQKLTPYVMKHKGLCGFSEWKQGFVLVRDGNIPTLMSDRLVVWSEYGAS